MTRFGKRIAAVGILLFCGCATAQPKHEEKLGFPIFGPTSGGGAVSAVSAGSGCVTVSPTTGAVIVTSSGCLANSGGAVALTNIAPVADQRILGNVSGSSASPIALTQAQAQTFLGIQSLIGLTDGPLNVTGSTGIVNSPTLTGLSATATTLVNDVVAGKNQALSTWIGGTATGQSVLIRPNGADATTGKIEFIGAPGVTTAYLSNENTFAQLVFGKSSATNANLSIETLQSVNGIHFGLYSQNASAGGGAGVNVTLTNGTGAATMQLHGNSFTTAGNVTAGTVMLRLISGSGNMLARLQQNTGDHVWETTTSNTERLRITNAGNVTVGTGLATTATDGFFYVPSGAGPPTGVPASPTLNSGVPLYIDRTNHKLYMYIGGWIGGTTPGAFN